MPPPPTVSALMVTFDHAAHVVEAIRSALAQTHPVDEVVLVDDGSTDGTVERARSVEDPRLRIFEQPHRGLEGLAETYNAGLRACRSELVGILEGDDLWPRDRLERQLPAFADPDVVLAHGPYAVIGARGTLLHPRVEPVEGLPPGPYDALPRHLLGSYVMAVTVTLRRAALLEAGGFRQLGRTPHWDYPTFLALAERGRFWNGKDVVGVWRKRAGSATHALAGSEPEGAALARDLALATRARLVDRADLPSPENIERSWADFFARDAWQAGRIMLVGRRYAEVRALARRALGQPCSTGPRLRLMALWLAALLHSDIERPLRWAGRRSTLEELR